MGRLGSYDQGEHGELSKESSIDLSSLTAEFCTDDFINKYFAEKFSKIADKGKWIQENLHNLEKDKENIEQAVKDGRLKDSKPETIWQRGVDMLKMRNEYVKAVQIEIYQNMAKIMEEVNQRLSKYLPNWKLPRGHKIIFTLEDSSDFWVDSTGTIYINLWLLAFNNNVCDNVSKGITHELFHLWLQENDEFLKNEEFISINQFAIYRIIDEGLAILIGDQKQILLDHYEKNYGINYTEYLKQSFVKLNILLSEKDMLEKKKLMDEGLNNMGFFYLIGHKVVSTILEYDGIEKLREYILLAPKNPYLLIQRYQEICEEDKEKQ